MKRAYLIAAVSMVTISCFGQHASSTYAASFSEADRISMVKNSINIPSWHEKSFWPVYEDYLSKAQAVSVQATSAMTDLANADETTSGDQAYSYATNVLNLQSIELEIQKEYFAQIGSAFNGIIAMQFLQTETALTMMESSNLYDGMKWRKYRFYPHLIKGDGTQVKAAKYNTMSKAVSLPPEKAQEFYQMYAKYEQECDQLLGENYSLIGLYAGEPTDYTPGLAKRLGYDMITIMERELLLKKKYFEKMNETVGPVLAARFLAWENYYALQSKMLAWSEGSE
jgi:hypothetical protein